MSEELEQNDGTWSGLKKTLVGTISTVILGAGTWVGTTLFGSNDKEDAAPVQQAAPVINLNLENNNTQTQSSGGGTKVIERVVEKPVDKPKPVRKKEGDEFKEKEPQW
jgi:hypothetical protein